MPFTPDQKMLLMFKAGRRCCVCMKFCGVRMEVDHIIQEADGGPNEEDNGIPLCFDCHADVKHYNARHPKGNKFRSDELKMHRDRMFRLIEQGGPLVLDAVAGQVLALPPIDVQSMPTSASLPQVDLERAARLDRYMRYSQSAERAERAGKFGDAIRLFESQFAIAESDTTLDDYAQIPGRYWGQKTALWRCYLESYMATKNEEHFHLAFNMGMDENTIVSIKAREPGWSGLDCRDYFYLLMQEWVLVLNARTRDRRPFETSISRLGNLLELTLSFNSPNRNDRLQERASALEIEMRAQLPAIADGRNLPPPDPYRRADALV